MKKHVKILLFCLTACCFIGCDRVTKDLAKEHLKHHVSTSYFHDTFRLIYVENTGAAFGLGDRLPRTAGFWLLGILPMAFLLGLAAYTIRRSGEMSMMKVIALSLIVAGGLGNITDRLLFNRHVTDFMNLGIKNVRTEIFNFADVYVMLGVVLFLLCYRDKKTSTQPSSLNTNA